MWEIHGEKSISFRGKLVSIVLSLSKAHCHYFSTSQSSPDASNCRVAIVKYIFLNGNNFIHP